MDHRNMCKLGLLPLDSPIPEEVTVKYVGPCIKETREHCKRNSYCSYVKHFSYSICGTDGILYDSECSLYMAIACHATASTTTVKRVNNPATWEDPTVTTFTIAIDMTKPYLEHLHYLTFSCSFTLLSLYSL